MSDESTAPTVVKAQGPLLTALEKHLHDKLAARLVAEGHSQAEVDAALGVVASSHPLLDLFMQYGLPFILQLLQNLLALNKPTPTPPPSA